MADLEEPLDIAVDSIDLAVEHPDLTTTSDIAFEPTEVITEHPKILEQQNINIEPDDLVTEHPKIAVQRGLKIEPTDIVSEHPKVVISRIKIEPDDIVTDHPKIIEPEMEPTDIMLDHPRVVDDDPEIEPTDIVLEHPETEPIDPVLQHQHIVNQATSTNTESTVGLKKVSEQSEMINPSQNHTENVQNLLLEIMLAKQTGTLSKEETLNKITTMTQDVMPELNIDSLVVIPRKEWGALEPKARVPLGCPAKAVLSTFTGTKTCSTDEDCRRLVKMLQIHHMERKNMPDIQWNFLVGGNGYIYEGRGFETAATKLPHFRVPVKECLDIAYIGETKVKDLTNTMFASMNGLVSIGVENKLIEENFVYLQEPALPESEELCIAGKSLRTG